MALGRKFDAVIGNPPYQEVREHGVKITGDGALWVQFTDLSLKLADDGGFLSLIIPNSVFGPAYDMMGSRRSFFNDDFKKRNLIHANLDVKRHFRNVGVSPVYFILENSDEYSLTELDAADGPMKVDIGNMIFIPHDSSAISMAVHERIMCAETNERPFKMRWTGDIRMMEENAQDVESETHRFPVFCYHSNNGILWSDRKDRDFHRRKILVSYVGHYKCHADGEGCMNAKCEVSVRFLADSEDAESAESFYDSELIHWLMNSNRRTQFQQTRLLNHIRPPAFDKIMTDEDVFVHYGLTEREREFVIRNSGKRK